MPAEPTTDANATDATPPRHLVDLLDWSRAELLELLDLADRLTDERRAGTTHDPCLAGQTLAMFFEKPSLRTRVSFEVACTELGGSALMLDQRGVGLGERESVADVIRVLSRMVHGVAARVFNHAVLQEMAEHATVPIINMLSDDSHPCQALADIQTMRQAFGPDLTGRTLVFVGDGNNCARSLHRIAQKLGFTFVLCSPAAHRLSAPGDEDVTWIADPTEAVTNADAIYCDTFVSMGDEEEKSERLKTFANYQVNAALMTKAPDHAIVLHCLPAYRGIEITDDVIDGPQSRVFPQAENRLHAQKALLATVMGRR